MGSGARVANGDRGRLREVAGVFLKLGIVGFGGPAAHVALMRREVVERRRWVSAERFLDLFAASNLIPGPSSTEMAIFLGYERAGWPALFLAGALFILPAFGLVLGLAWLYVRFGSVEQARWVLYGVTPVVIGIVSDAIWRLGRAAIRTIPLLLLALAVLALFLAGVNPLFLLFGGGALAMLAANRRRLGWRAGALAPLAGRASLSALLAASGGASFSLVTLSLTFLKIGAVAYGGGYVLLAFLRADFVTHLHWLTDRQLVDAVAVGQVTPGPVFTTATFVGFLTGGLAGAALATGAIFAPSFVFVALTHRILPAGRRSPWAVAFLDGATASALGLMAAVSVQLGRAVVVDGVTTVLAAASFGALRRWNVNAVWLIAGGAAAGLAWKAAFG